MWRGRAEKSLSRPFISSLSNAFCWSPFRRLTNETAICQNKLPSYQQDYAKQNIFKGWFHSFFYRWKTGRRRNPKSLYFQTLISRFVDFFFRLFTDIKGKSAALIKADRYQFAYSLEFQSNEWRFLSFLSFRFFHRNPAAEKIFTSKDLHEDWRSIASMLISLHLFALQRAFCKKTTINLGSVIAARDDKENPNWKISPRVDKSER